MGNLFDRVNEAYENVCSLYSGNQKIADEVHIHKDGSRILFEYEARTGIYMLALTKVKDGFFIEFPHTNNSEGIKFYIPPSGKKIKKRIVTEDHQSAHGWSACTKTDSDNVNSFMQAVVYYNRLFEQEVKSSYIILEEKIRSIEDALSGSGIPYILQEYGKSEEGRPLYKFVLGDKSSEPISIVAGIHAGTEHQSVFGALEVIKRLKDNRDMLDKYNISVYVCANPDGYQYRKRENSENIDLNRDFNGSSRSKEAKALRESILGERPKFVLDMHERAIIDMNPSFLILNPLHDKDSYSLEKKVANDAITAVKRNHDILQYEIMEFNMGRYALKLKFHSGPQVCIDLGIKGEQTQTTIYADSYIGFGGIKSHSYSTKGNVLEIDNSIFVKGLPRQSMHTIRRNNKIFSSGTFRWGEAVFQFRNYQADEKIIIEKADREYYITIGEDYQITVSFPRDQAKSKAIEIKDVKSQKTERYTMNNTIISSSIPVASKVSIDGTVDSLDWIRPSGNFADFCRTNNIPALTLESPTNWTLEKRKNSLADAVMGALGSLLQHTH